MSSTDLQNGFDEAEKPEDQFRTIVETIPTLVWVTRADGAAEFLNRRWLDYTGLLAEQALEWGWTVAIHPDDRSRVVGYWRCILASGEAGELEAARQKRSLLAG